LFGDTDVLRKTLSLSRCAGSLLAWVVALWLTPWLHLLFQFATLQLLSFPVREMTFLPYSGVLTYQNSVISTFLEATVVLFGSFGPALLVSLLVALCDIFAHSVPSWHLPRPVSHLLLRFAFASAADPGLHLLLVDLPLTRYRSRHGIEHAVDATKLYATMGVGSFVPAALLTLLVWLAATMTGTHAFYRCLVHVHDDGAIMDAFFRACELLPGASRARLCPNAPPGCADTQHAVDSAPADLEVHSRELVAFLQRAVNDETVTHAIPQIDGDVPSAASILSSLDGDHLAPEVRLAFGNPDAPASTGCAPTSFDRTFVLLSTTYLRDFPRLAAYCVSQGVPVTLAVTGTHERPSVAGYLADILLAPRLLPFDVEATLIAVYDLPLDETVASAADVQAAGFLRRQFIVLRPSGACYEVLDPERDLARILAHAGMRAAAPASALTFSLLLPPIAISDLFPDFE
jgi:hypothetical protein